MRAVLILSGIDQIEADPRETIAGNVEGRAGLGHRMHPAQTAQIVVVQRLNAHRHAVDPAIGKGAEPAHLDAGRVGLQRDLDVIGKGPGAAGGLNDAGHGLGGHQAGGAAAKEDAVEHPARGLGRQTGDLATIGGQPARLVDGRRDMAVEVAIGTFRRAERPMDVKRKAPCPPILGKGRGAGGGWQVQCHSLSAVTSISIFISVLMSPATTIVAAGNASFIAAPSTGTTSST